jgi:hypothetical protein
MKISKNVRRVFLAIVLIGVVTGSWAVWYVFFKPHRNIGEEKAAFTLTTQKLSEEIKTDTAAFSKYVDKTMLIEGPVSAIEGSHVSFGNIICNIDSTDISKLSKVSVGQVLKVQGRLTTYNDLMEEIMLDQCVLK